MITKLALLLFVFSSLIADEKITVEIEINAQMSEELEALKESIPTGESDSWDEWKDSFVKNMNRLIDLVESGKVGNTVWSIDIEED